MHAAIPQDSAPSIIDSSVETKQVTILELVTGGHAAAAPADTTASIDIPAASEQHPVPAGHPAPDAPAPAERDFKWTPRIVAASLLLFVCSGFAEIGGGWLIWRTIRCASALSHCCSVLSGVRTVRCYLWPQQPAWKHWHGRTAALIAALDHSGLPV